MAWVSNPARCQEPCVPFYPAADDDVCPVPGAVPVPGAAQAGPPGPGLIPGAGGLAQAALPRAPGIQMPARGPPMSVGTAAQRLGARHSTPGWFLSPPGCQTSARWPRRRAGVRLRPQRPAGGERPRRCERGKRSAWHGPVSAGRSSVSRTLPGPRPRSIDRSIDRVDSLEPPSSPGQAVQGCG